jgi:hypothetical protein
MEKTKCVYCGAELETKDMVAETVEDEVVLFCHKCAFQFGTCAMCNHNLPCGFFDDPDPMPQFTMVARQVHQGSVTFIEQKRVPNAERVKKFCIEGKCSCYNGDDEHPLCCRFGGYATCTNYDEVKKQKFVQDFSIQNTNEN